MSTKVKKKIASKKSKRNDFELATHSTQETRVFLEKLTGGPLTFGEMICTIRECDEISQTDFAKKLGVSKSYLCDLEKNRKEISLKKAAEFARILGDSEKFFICILLRDMFRRSKLPFTVDVRDAA